MCVFRAHLGGVELSVCLAEALVGLLHEQPVQLAPRVQLHDKVQVLLRLERGVQRGQERVVDPGENLLLHLYIVTNHIQLGNL